MQLWSVLRSAGFQTFSALPELPGCRKDGGAAERSRNLQHLSRETPEEKNRREQNAASFAKRLFAQRKAFFLETDTFTLQKHGKYGVTTPNISWFKTVFSVVHSF